MYHCNHLLFALGLGFCDPVDYGFSHGFSSRASRAQGLASMSTWDLDLGCVVGSATELYYISLII